MKRYALFWFAQFYPSGGWDDYVESFRSIQGATKYFKTHKDGPRYRFGDWQLVDLQTEREIPREEWMS